LYVHLLQNLTNMLPVNVLITLGSERLYSDLSRKFSSRPNTDPSEVVTVLRLDKSGGCVDRTEDYMKSFRDAQIREYFFGRGDEMSLAPSSQSADVADLHLFRISEDPTPIIDEYGVERERGLYEKVAVGEGVVNRVLAITMVSPKDSPEAIRDSSVSGYIYVAGVDEGRRKVKLLAPLPGETPDTALVLGSWPEAVEGLVG
jgi:polyribonucleotide 5'-hydroxyl-kinase